jgi:multicomponent Na+:H+ antiporter subunit F
MNVQNYVMVAVALFLGLAVICTFIRLLIGPTLADRVVALDLLSMVAIGIIAVYAVSTAQPVFLDVGLILALVAFLGTIAYAHLLEKGGRAHIERDREIWEEKH